MKLEITNLYKKYKEKFVLQNINLQIENGIIGIYGSKNAGKTTLLNILCGLTDQTEGEVIINKVRKEDIKETRSVVGYMPQDFSAYPHMSVTEMMDYLGILSGIKSPSERRKRISALLSQFDINHFSKTKVKILPKEIKQKMGIAQALIHNPEIILLDEPLVGLNSTEIETIGELLQNEKENKVIILSSEKQDKIQCVCDSVVELNNGQLGEVREVS